MDRHPDRVAVAGLAAPEQLQPDARADPAGPGRHPGLHGVRGEGPLAPEPQVHGGHRRRDRRALPGPLDAQPARRARAHAPAHGARRGDGHLGEPRPAGVAALVRPLRGQPAPGLAGGRLGSHRLGDLDDLEAERVDDRGVELLAGAAAQLGQRVFDRVRGAVDAVGHHRVEGVADGDDAGAERDVLAGEAVGVAGAVPALVAGAHDAPRPAAARAPRPGSARR